MADTLTKAARSALMRRIRSRDTGPERVVRSCLHRLGLRFRLHDRRLPGSPDIVLPRHRTVIFVHGCFWHHHGRCRLAYVPGTRRQFWLRKFADNRRRDRTTARQLRRLGWKVVVIWECQVESENGLVGRLLAAFRTRDR
jgi:DNA mismatch endonuclease (patch repair protein)